MQQVEWGEFTYESIFNKIVQGKRLKKNDQVPGDIPFIMAGITNAGVVNFISNPVNKFPENSITVDIFGNVFYRDFEFSAGDDTGVYWNDEKKYSKKVMLFLAISMGKSLRDKFSFGKKLRSSQSFGFKILLPTKNGEIDFEFMEKFITEMETVCMAEKEMKRRAKIEAYLLVSGLKDYTLTTEEQQALNDLETLKFSEFNVTDVFDIKNTGNILSRDIIKNSGETPYLCASAENNAVDSYISHDEKYIDKGNCIFIGGKTFVVSYQEKNFYSNDSHNLVLYLKEKEEGSMFNHLYLATCINKSLKHKYSWDDSVSKAKIKKDKISLPVENGHPNYKIMGLLISAVQKLIIKDLVLQISEEKID